MCYSANVPVLKGYGEVLQDLVLFSITRDQATSAKLTGGFNTLIYPTALEWSISVLAYVLIAVCLGYIMYAFLLVILLWHFICLKKGVLGAKGVGHDLGTRVRWKWQVNMSAVISHFVVFQLLSGFSICNN